MIKQCQTCLPTQAAADQDRRYGVNNRVHNSAYANKSPVWRCTVCEKETPMTKEQSKSG